MSEKASLLKPVLSITFFIGFLVLFYFLIGKDKTELPSQLINHPAPQFKVVDLLDPSIFHTEKEFLGKITLLNVWASWCPSCYSEHPFWRQYAKNKDITLMGLNYRDKEKKALKFINQQGNSYQGIIFDKNGRLGIEFGVYGAPETFIIDPKGKIRYRHVGVVTPQAYKNIILPLVEKIKRGF